MCRPFIIVAFALLAIACRRDPLFPGTPRYSHEPDTPRRTPADSAADPLANVPPGEHIYLTAVRYPDGFDWERDTCAVEGTVLLDLYRDGVLIFSIPAGASIHPDMHRFTHGHLYSDASTDTETILRRDGEELFRFPGREALRGFLIREDGIHTLGQDRDGAGFTYRVEGREVYRSETGTVLGGLDESGTGALTEMGEDVYYACRLPSDRGFEYRVLRNAEVFRSVTEGEDVRAFGFMGGKVCRVLFLQQQWFLETDGQLTQLGTGSGETLLWCRLTASGNGILALACITGAEGRRYFLRADDGRMFQPDAGETVSLVLAEGLRMGWTESDDAGHLLRFRWSDGECLSVTREAFLASGRCALLQNGHLLLALTGRGGASNGFQLDAECTDIPFNGYFTSVTVE